MFFVIFIVVILVGKSMYRQKNWVEPTLLDVVEKRYNDTVKFDYCTVLHNYLTFWNLWRVEDYEELERVHAEFVTKNVAFFGFAAVTSLLCFVAWLINQKMDMVSVFLILMIAWFPLILLFYFFTFFLLAIERDVLTATITIFDKAANRLQWVDYFKSLVFHKRHATCFEALSIAKEDALRVQNN